MSAGIRMSVGVYRSDNLLKASALQLLFPNLYSILYVQAESVNFHFSRHDETNWGMAYVGPNKYDKGLWSCIDDKFMVKSNIIANAFLSK